MTIRKFIICLFITFIGVACEGTASKNTTYPNIETTIADSLKPSTSEYTVLDTKQIQLPQTINSVTGIELVNYAKTLVGIPYCYASTDPLKGFDCSGFITYVFNHFNIAVPRSSVDFTNIGKTIAVQDAKAGDLILFTGTVDSIRVVGHMGIVTENRDTLKFIHATSGKAYGVTISALNEHYKPRFVKVISIFKK